MLNTLRRVVTENDATGRSRILTDGPPGNVIEADGAGLGELWCVEAVPAPLDAPDPTGAEIRLEPPAGGVKFRYFTVAPEDPSRTDEEREAAAAFGFEAVHAAAARVDTTRHPMMHKTPTVDYIILLKGEVTLLLDDDETDLKPGDVVVQRGTNHAWVNKGGETALLIAVLIDGQTA
jgi:mannose-6-phosphate isomerase-like protein (cupin superfamily)